MALGLSHAILYGENDRYSRLKQIDLVDWIAEMIFQENIHIMYSVHFSDSIIIFYYSKFIALSYLPCDFTLLRYLLLYHFFLNLIFVTRATKIDVMLSTN